MRANSAGVFDQGLVVRQNQTNVVSSGSVLVLPSMPKVPASSPLTDRLRAVAYFTNLSQVTLEALASIAIVRTFRAGAAIFWEGEPATDLYVIAEGVVKICRHSVDGREYILHLLHPSDTFNDVAAMDGGANPATAIAYSDVVVLAIPRSELIRVTQQYPELAWALIESMARRARYLVAKVEDLSIRSVKGRLARLLLEQAYRNDAQALPRLLTQEEMANQLGTVREMVGRALRTLADDGMIEFDRHHINILDVDRLAHEAAS